MFEVCIHALYDFIFSHTSRSFLHLPSDGVPTAYNYYSFLPPYAAAWSGRLALDWDLWRTLFQLSYSAVAALYDLYFALVRAQTHVFPSPNLGSSGGQQEEGLRLDPSEPRSCRSGKSLEQSARLQRTGSWGPTGNRRPGPSWSRRRWWTRSRDVEVRAVHSPRPVQRRWIGQGLAHAEVAKFQLRRIFFKALQLLPSSSQKNQYKVLTISQCCISNVTLLQFNLLVLALLYLNRWIIENV